MGVPADDQVDGVIHALDDVNDRTRDAGTRWRRQRQDGDAAFMQHDDDRLDVLLAQFAGVAVGRLGLVQEVQVRHA
jgi:hypothetical protein